MTIQYLLLLALPILLNIQGNPVFLVFLAMNLVINLFMQYTQIQLKILGSLLDNEAILDKHNEAGSTEEVAFEAYMENVDEEDAEEWILMPIKIASHLSMLISILGILAGIVNLFR